MNNQQSSSLPYIGSKISLITTYDIRYEGILTSLNQKESTIAVQNVRSFGTEGRKEPEVPMSNEIYDYIVFSGKDLKDLTVIQEQKEESKENKNFPSEKRQVVTPQVERLPPPPPQQQQQQQQQQNQLSKGGWERGGNNSSYSQGNNMRDNVAYNYNGTYHDSYNNGSYNDNISSMQQNSSSGVNNPQQQLPQQVPQQVPQQQQQLQAQNQPQQQQQQQQQHKEAQSISPRFDSPYKHPPSTPPPRTFQNGYSPDANGGNMGGGNQQNNNYNDNRRDNNASSKNGSYNPNYNSYNPNHSYTSGKGGYSDMRSESSYGKNKGYYNKGYYNNAVSNKDNYGGYSKDNNGGKNGSAGGYNNNKSGPVSNNNNNNNNNNNERSGATSNERVTNRRKTLADIFPSHPATERFLVDAIKKKTASALEAEALRSTSESSESLYHFFLDFVNHVIPKEQANASDEKAQWEAFSKALKVHFESECRQYPVITAEINVNDVFKAPLYNDSNALYNGSAPTGNAAWGASAKMSTVNSAQKPAEIGGRPGLTLGDFAIAEATKKTKPSAKKVPVKVYNKPEASKNQTPQQSYSAASEWICPRCTLKNSANAPTCGACGFTKDQAKLMDEFPPLGAPAKK